MAFTEAQQWALVILPKITGLISLVFSGLVIFTVCVCEKKRSKETYHRLLVGISCVDCSSSFWLGLSTWPIPEKTGIKWASGTTASCTAQGFFTQFGIASSFYNASLSIFYLLVIRYGWKEEAILKLEPWLHAVPVLWGLGTSIAGLPLTIFNSANLWCWIAPYEDRGAHADLFRWVFFYGPLWGMILLVTINVMLIFKHVRTLEKATERYQDHDEIQYAGDLGVIDDTSENCSASAKETREKGPFDSNDDDKEANEHRAVDSNEEEEEEKANEQPPSVGARDEDAAAIVSPTKAGRTKKALPSMAAPSFRKSVSMAVSFRSSVTGNRRSKRRRKGHSRDVANQCLRFAGSFYFTWIALTLTRLMQAINGETYFPLLVIAATTTPLQGLPNFLVFLYPRYQKAKQNKPSGSAWSWLKNSISPEGMG